MNVDDLPKDVFVRIFGSPLLSHEDRLSKLPLVCKRWNSILKEPSSIWSHIVIRYPADYIKLEKWMKLRAESVDWLDVHVADHIGYDTHEATLLVGNLIKTAINHTKLQRLRIFGGNRLYMNCERWLPNLSFLRHLYLEEKNPDATRFFPSWFLSINYLTRLQSLEIRGDEYDLPYEGSREYRALPSALRGMSELESLKLDKLGICAFAEEEFTDENVKAISSLKGLRELILTGFEFTNVTPLAALTKLERLSLSWGPYQPFNAVPLTQLRQFSYEFYGCAEQMNEMALHLPEGLLDLRISTLGVWRRNPFADEAARHEDREHLILDLLTQRVNFPASVQRVDLAGLGLSVVPPALLALRELRELCMPYNRLTALPDGEWLHKMEVVDLTHNQITTGAGPLKAILPSIKHLYLGSNPED